jgi:hypothetical protein
MNTEELPDFESAVGAMSPDAYKYCLENTQLTNITLERLETSLVRSVLEGSHTLEVEIERSLSYRQPEASTHELWMDYLLQTRVQNQEAFALSGVYRLQFSAHSPLPKAFFTIYGKISGDKQVWPFLRELTASVTERMGVSRLVLPLLMDESQIKTRPFRGKKTRKSTQKAVAEANS